MGVDWFRMRPKADANPEVLIKLIHEQFTYFPYSGGHIKSLYTDKILYDNLSEEQLTYYATCYGESSKALQALLEIEPYPPLDFPNFEVCWRVYPITYNLIFPRQLRRDAYRTFLPEELPKQLEIWKNYIADVHQGKLKPYLLDLYLYYISKSLYEHWEFFQDSAQASLSRTNNWVNKPALQLLQAQILNLTAPYRHPTPPDLPPEKSYYTPEFISRLNMIYELVQSQAEELVKLTCAWNAKVPKNWKHRIRGISYNFDEFMELSKDLWLTEFFTWVERCCAQGMGLYLDC